MRNVIIPKEFIHLAWDHAAPLIQRALDHAKDEILLEDVRERLEEGKYILFMVVEEEKPLAAVVMEIRQFLRKEIVSITLAGGERMNEWFEGIAEAAEDLAREHGATAVYITGRRGWVRQMMPLGYSEYFTTIGKELEVER